MKNREEIRKFKARRTENIDTDSIDQNSDEYVKNAWYQLQFVASCMRDTLNFNMRLTAIFTRGNSVKYTSNEDSSG